MFKKVTNSTIHRQNMYRKLKLTTTELWLVGNQRSTQQGLVVNREGVELKRQQPKLEEENGEEDGTEGD